jgi:hypothetical protein
MSPADLDARAKQLPYMAMGLRVAQGARAHRPPSPLPRAAAS